MYHVKWYNGELELDWQNDNLMVGQKSDGVSVPALKRERDHGR